MIVTNTSGNPVECRAKPSGSGGGPEAWQGIGPHGSYVFALPSNTLWELECRLAGSQLISTVQAASNAEVELTIVGARVRVELADRQPIQY